MLLVHDQEIVFSPYKLQYSDFFKYITENMFTCKGDPFVSCGDNFREGSFP